jgi:hypothetical protein
VRRGSYFFALDAFIASLIIVAAIALVFTRFLSAQGATQAFYTAEDVLLVLETTNVRDLDSQLVRNWSLNGTINDTSLPVLEQLALFNATGMNAQALSLANLSIASVPEHVNVELSLAGQTYAQRVGVPKRDASVLFSSKRIVLVRKFPSDAYDPVLVEVQTWQ